MTTYIKGNAKAIEGNFWEFFNISLNLEDLQQHVNDKWRVNLTMSKRKEVWQYWDTHSLILNEYKPKEAKTNEFWDKKIEEISIESIPF